MFSLKTIVVAFTCVFSTHITKIFFFYIFFFLFILLSPRFIFLTQISRENFNLILIVNKLKSKQKIKTFYFILSCGMDFCCCKGYLNEQSFSLVVLELEKFDLVQYNDKKERKTWIQINFFKLNIKTLKWSILTV